MASEWTAERIATLRRLWDEGYSCSQIAHEMGFLTRNAVIGKAHRLGLESRKIVRRAGPRAARKAATPRPRKSTYAYAVLPDHIEPVKVELREADATPLHIDIHQLNVSTCRWPYGDGPFTFCGCAPVKDSPYCAPHNSIAHGPGTAAERGALKFKVAA